MKTGCFPTVYNVYVLCAFATVGGLLFGFDISSMSGVIGTRGYTSYFGVTGGGYKQGGITSAMAWGSLVGSFGASWLADHLSRVTTLQIAAVCWIIGSVFMCAANGLALLIVGRIVCGFGVGMASTVVPIYQAEVAPKEIRGGIISLQQWAITWGIMIQYFIQYGCSFIGGGPDNPNQGTASFRIPWGIQIVPGVIFLGGLMFFPKSPRWLAAHDRWEETMEVLARLHGKGNREDPKVLAEYKEIEDAMIADREGEKATWFDLAKPRNLKRVSLGMGLQMWSQLSGMNVMMYYIVYIMQSIGIGSPLLTSAIQYVLNVVMTLPAIMFLDRMGRRPTILAGFFMMAVWLYLVGGLQGGFGEPYHSDDPTDPLSAITWRIPDDERSAGKGIIACSYLFVCSFATTIGPTSWAYPAEIYPLNIRAKAVALATATNWTWNALLGLFVPPLLHSINWKMYMIFAAFNSCAFCHMFLACFETKGYTLEEMGDIFDSGKWPWQKMNITSRLDELKSKVEAGEAKIAVPTVSEKRIEETVEHA
ncbi:MFS sugar transporter [Ascosphaera acerosa]|nr:MFS sugar transporter [Ascosphaera acerosa]